MCFDRDFFNLNYCVFLSIFEPQPCSTFIPTLVSISHGSFFHFSRCQCRLGYFGAVSIILQSIIFIADRVSHCAPFHSKLCGMWLFIFTLDSTGFFFVRCDERQNAANSVHSIPLWPAVCIYLLCLWYVFVAKCLLIGFVPVWAICTTPIQLRAAKKQSVVCFSFA